MESPFSNITSSFSAQHVRQPVLENSLKDTFSVILTLDVASITTWFTCRQIKTSRTAIVRRVSAPGTSPRSSHFSSAFLFLSHPLLGLPNALEQSSPADSFAESRHHRDNQVGLNYTHNCCDEVICIEQVGTQSRHSTACTCSTSLDAKSNTKTPLQRECAVRSFVATS